MSKSTLSITVNRGPIIKDTIEVPCRLPEAFNFNFAGKTYTAILNGHGAELSIEQVDFDGFTPQDEEFNEAGANAESILSTIKATLGITGPVPPGSPLPAIALAYEAECAAHAAGLRALGSLPRDIHGLTGIAGNHPSDESPLGTPFSPAARMLAKYVEHVVQNATAQVAK